MSLTSILPDFLLFLAGYKYLLLFLGVAIEGPILMVASGVLILNGFFELTPSFLVIIAGDLFGDIVWYYIGYFFAGPFINKYGRFFKITPETFDKAKNLFHKYHIKILLISKVTIGLGISLATLIAAGATRISFKKYILLNFLGEIILVSILLSVGYFFGQLYNNIADSIKIYFVVGAVAAIAISGYFFNKYIKHKIIS